MGGAGERATTCGALMAGLAVALSTLSLAGCSADAISAAPGDGSPPAGGGTPTPSTAARTGPVVCPNGGISNVILDREPEFDPGVTAEIALAAWLAHHHAQDSPSAPWFVEANFEQVPRTGDGRRDRPDRARAYRGHRPDGTAFIEAHFVRHRPDGGWYFTGAEYCTTDFG